MKFYIYILESKLNKHYYVGSTEDIDKRLEYHNSPKARWTKRFQPWVLIHSEEFETRSEAILRERQIKSYKNTSRFLETLNAKV